MDSKNKKLLRLNSSNLLSPPIAESTHISEQKFPWGSGLNKSSTNTIKNHFSTRLNNDKLLQPKISISNNTIRTFNSNIDARTYTDAQSRGLASRIVKYHENNSKLNCSMSITNLYNKPGQFPVVHLKKTKLPVKLNRNQSNVSMIKIAPPIRSVFQANSRASILRSCSAVGILEKSTELSHDDKPILHTNEIEQNGTPTRSVLEVLKEISRKRINSDESDISSNNIKKYCRESNVLGDKYLNNNDIDSKISENTCVKRQRELSYSPNNTNLNLDKSPEQVSIKRRLHTYSNDISSSLSSSLSIVSSKRKMLLNDSRHHEQKTKNMKVVYDKHTIHLNKSIKIDEPKNSLKNEHLSEYDECKDLNDSTNQTTKNNVLTSGKNIISEFNNKESTKPKLTLFNKNYSIECIPVMQEDIEDENSNILFVKPKKSSLKLSRNSLIEKAQKSKLALMLSSLKGELLEEDQVDFSNEENVKERKESSKTEEMSNLLVNIYAKSAKENIINENTTTKLNFKNQSENLPNNNSVIIQSDSIPTILSTTNIQQIEPPINSSDLFIGMTNTTTQSSTATGLNTSRASTVNSSTTITKFPTTTRLLESPMPSNDSAVLTNSFFSINTNSTNMSSQETPISCNTFIASSSPSDNVTNLKIPTNDTEGTVLNKNSAVSNSKEIFPSMSAPNSVETETLSSLSTNLPNITNINNTIKNISNNTSSSLFSFENQSSGSKGNSINAPNNEIALSIPKSADYTTGLNFGNYGKNDEIFDFKSRNSNSILFENNISKTSIVPNNNGNDLKFSTFPVVNSSLPTSLFTSSTNTTTEYINSGTSTSSALSDKIEIGRNVGEFNITSTKVVESNEPYKFQINVKRDKFSLAAQNDDIIIFGNNSEKLTKNKGVVKDSLISFDSTLRENPIFNNSSILVNPAKNDSSLGFNFAKNIPIFGTVTDKKSNSINKPDNFVVNNNSNSIFSIYNEKNSISEAGSKTECFTFGGINKTNSESVFGNANNYSFALGSNSLSDSFDEHTKVVSGNSFGFGGSSHTVKSIEKTFNLGSNKQTDAFNFRNNKTSPASTEKLFTFADNKSISTEVNKSFAFNDNKSNCGITKLVAFGNNKTTSLGQNNLFGLGDKTASESFSSTTDKNNQVSGTNTIQEQAFNFGSSANQLFAFNGSHSTPNNIQNHQSNTFNFSSSHCAGLPNNNLFNAVPGERPIRKATRRLQK